MISVLMAVWGGDRGDWVRLALESVAAQTRPAEEVVLVEDGPVGDDVRSVIEEVGSRLPLTRVPLAENKGLSHALQEGLPHCRHDLVARVDSDDVCEPVRFERQAAVFAQRPGLSALGGLVAEFVDDPTRPYAVRPVPVGPDEVRRWARWRCPLNHPTVMFRRRDVQAVGGYSGFVGMEDYYLWAKMLAAHMELDNLAEVLVRQRAGRAMGDRRGGLEYARTELRLLRAFGRIGFLSPRETVLSGLIRIPVRLMPAGARARVYRSLLRRPVVER